MRSSDDLLKVMGMMWEEMVNLGIENLGPTIRFVEEDEDGVDVRRRYYAFDNPRKFGISWTSSHLFEFNEEIVVGEVKAASSRDQIMIDSWSRGEVVTVAVSGEDYASRFKELTESWGLDRPIPIPERAEWAFNYVPFEHGVIGFIEPTRVEEHLTIVQELADALSLGYVRYLDFQQLEEQNRVLEEHLRLLRETQSRLIMQEKMASLGDLVSGVAHEINNPIGVVISAADVARRCAARIEDGEIEKPLATLKANIDAMLEAGDRIDALVKSLRNFARLDEAEFQIADLHEGIDSVLTLLKTLLGERIVVNKNYGKIQPVYCSPSQLNQVFMHLLKNAIEAIEGSGHITISTGETDDGVCIRIRDTGRGIPADQLARIFDFDFHATDKRMKMGFGLSTDYRIIQDHRGKIEMESKVGKGTMVMVSLPVEIGLESI